MVGAHLIDSPTIYQILPPSTNHSPAWPPILGVMCNIYQFKRRHREIIDNALAQIRLVEKLPAFVGELVAPGSW